MIPLRHERDRVAVVCCLVGFAWARSLCGVEGLQPIAYLPVSVHGVGSIEGSVV